MIIDCIKDHLLETFNDIILNCNGYNVLEVRVFGFLNPRCRLVFYNSFVRVGEIIQFSCNNICDVYYDDPDMLRILKNLVCVTLNLGC